VLNRFDMIGYIPLRNVVTIYAKKQNLLEGCWDLVFVLDSGAEIKYTLRGLDRKAVERAVSVIWDWVLHRDYVNGGIPLEKMFDSVRGE